MIKIKERWSYKELSIIANNLSMLYGEGLNITSAIDLLKDFPISKKYRKALNIISDDVVQGKSLNEAFSKHGKLFPRFYIQMIKSGEETGNISGILNELGEYYSEMERVKKEIKSACFYPSLLLVAMFAIFIVFMMIVIPNFENMITTSNEQLPFYTELLIVFSNVLREKWPVILFMFVIWGVIIPIVFFKSNIKLLFIKLLCKFKITKDILEYKTIITLNIIISSGVNLTKGLMTCGESDDGNLFEELNNSINKGESFTEALKRSSNLSDYSLAMIEIGEDSGTLDKSIKSVTKVLKTRNKGSLAKINRMIQPALVGVISIAVLIFLVAFILPLFDVIYNVGV